MTEQEPRMTEQEFRAQITYIFNNALAAIKRNFNINLKVEITKVLESQRPYRWHVILDLTLPSGKTKHLGTGFSIYKSDLLSIPVDWCKEHGFDCNDEKVTCLPTLTQNILRMSAWFYCHYLEYNTEF